ncbi:MAG TPA: signal peptidase I [Candidatus Paceibacterota bacterium]|nr:signal peptidase I [Candidatus Paceibacterota bacterium]
MTDPVMTPSQSSDHSSARDARSGGFAWYVTLALGLALFIRFFVAAPYVVSGASMEPTFDNWDYLITDRLSYDFSAPERGDVIVFCLPNTGECSLWKRIAQQEWRGPRTLIKRVIGLPGETIAVEGGQIRITNAENPNGFVLEEPYVADTNIGGPTGMEVTLGEGEYFVLGDNRKVSSDSRVWGALPKENIIGQVLVRLFPIDVIGLFPGDATYVAE